MNEIPFTTIEKALKLQEMLDQYREISVKIRDFLINHCDFDNDILWYSVLSHAQEAKKDLTLQIGYETLSRLKK